jgi:cysteinyl-tRNA synthetase
MTLRLRNTLTRSTEAVEPADGTRLRMYSCGPTVYRFAHVGNLRTFLLADLIRRVVLYHGTPVLHVQNITDVGHLRDERFDRGEDRMLVAAGLEHRSTAEIADAYEAAFHEDAALLNLLPAQVFPRATEHIPEMIELAERLVDAGHAYVSDLGNVYFSVASFRSYGALSGNTLDALRAGHRGEVDADKRDPADFALWKAAGEGRELKWPTARWGAGFPGWHLECSAMAMRHLGPRFDVHTGGIDNVFPHHEDEIAQSAPVVGGPPARVWVHGEFLQVGGRKMAKSAGNIERIADVAARGIDPLSFRYLCLTSRYRHKLEYTEDSLAGAAAGLASLRAAVSSLASEAAVSEPAAGVASPPDRSVAALRAGRAPARPRGTVEAVTGNGDGEAPSLVDRAHGSSAGHSPDGRDLHDRFVAAIDDDLDLPTALAVVRETARAALPAGERLRLILDADFVLGLDLDRDAETGAGSQHASRVDEMPNDVAGIVARRATARAARDYGTSDALRSELADLGYEVTDGRDGQTVRRR